MVDVNELCATTNYILAFVHDSTSHIDGERNQF